MSIRHSLFIIPISFFITSTNLWHHLEFDKNITIRSIINSGLHSLGEPNSNSAKVDIMGLDLNATIGASANDLKVILLEEGLNVRGIDKHSILGLTTSRIEVPNRILKVIVNVFGVDWYFDVVVLLL